MSEAPTHHSRARALGVAALAALALAACGDVPTDTGVIDAVDVLQSRGRGVAAMQSVADEVAVAGGTVSLIFDNPAL